MNKINKSSFLILSSALFVLFVTIFLVSFFFPKPVESPPVSNHQVHHEDDDISPPEFRLENLGVNTIDSIYVDKEYIRNFNAGGRKGLYVFGETIERNRKNPALEFTPVIKDTPIIASIDGEVSYILNQDQSSDYEVFLKPSNSSPWQVSYDHLTDVTLKVGDKLKAGDIVGKPALQNNGFYRYEIQVYKNDENGGKHICPTSVLSEAVKDMWLKGLRDLQLQWNQGAQRIMYDTESQEPIGCVTLELTNEEAEGS